MVRCGGGRVGGWVEEVWVEAVGKEWLRWEGWGGEGWRGVGVVGVVGVVVVGGGFCLARFTTKTVRFAAGKSPFEQLSLGLARRYRSVSLSIPTVSNRRAVDEDSVLGHIRDFGLVPRSHPAWLCVLAKTRRFVLKVQNERRNSCRLVGAAKSHSGR